MTIISYFIVGQYLKHFIKLLFIFIFIFFTNHLFAIGDGPRLEESDFLILLGILVFTIAGIVYLIYNIKILRKLVTWVIITSMILLGFAYLGSEYKSYDDISEYKDFFCEKTRNNKDRVYIENLVNFKRLNDSKKSSDNILIKLTNINNKAISCMEKYNSKDKETLNNAAFEFLINKDYKKSKDIFYKLSSKKNKEAAYYYYLLTGDACYFYYHENSINSPFEQVCKNKSLKIKQEKNTDYFILNLLKNNNQDRFNVKQYYVIGKNDKELSFQILRHVGTNKGYDKALYSVYTNNNILIKEGLTNSNGEIFFPHKKGTTYYVFTFNINTEILMSVIELEK